MNISSMRSRTMIFNDLLSDPENYNNLQDISEMLT